MLILSASLRPDGLQPRGSSVHRIFLLLLSLGARIFCLVSLSTAHVFVNSFFLSFFCFVFVFLIKLSSIIQADAPSVSCWTKNECRFSLFWDNILKFSPQRHQVCISLTWSFFVLLQKLTLCSFYTWSLFWSLPSSKGIPGPLISHSPAVGPPWGRFTLLHLANLFSFKGQLSSWDFWCPFVYKKDYLREFWLLELIFHLENNIEEISSSFKIYLTYTFYWTLFNLEYKLFYT